jgi:glycosyltransferase involved in cell wall biosynthesis
MVKTSKPDLLYLSPVVPALAGNGLAMRAGTVLELLAAHYAVHLLIAPLYTAFDSRVPERLERLCRSSVIVPPVPPTPRLPGLSGWPLPWFGPRPVFATTRFAVVHVFRLSMLPFAEPYLNRFLHRPSRHLDLDDIESVTRSRIAELYRSNGEFSAADYEETEARRQEPVENEALKKFDRVYVCSEIDRQKLSGRTAAEVLVLPNAIRISEGVRARPAGGLFTFLFIGTLGYYPNQDAVRYFCTEIVPRIREHATAPFLVNVVGFGDMRPLRPLIRIPEVRLIGAVPGVRPWMEATDAVVVPVRAGGGTRIKILEAFSFQRPVVSTSTGREGIAARDDEHILIGDTPERFAEQCLRLMGDRALGARLAANARRLAEDEYSIEALARKMVSYTNRISTRRG